MDSPYLPEPELAPVAAAPEQRRSYRRPMLASGILQLEGVAGAASQRAVRVVDLSADGVGLRCPTPIAPGSRFTLRIHGHPQHRCTPARAVHCRRGIDGDYDVGGHFIASPDDD